MATFAVTRHQGALEWLRRRHPDAVEVAHLDPAAVRPGDLVLGTLPAHLAGAVCARGARYLHLAIDAPEGSRGRELSADEMEAAGARLVEMAVAPVSQPDPVTIGARVPLDGVQRRSGSGGKVGRGLFAAASVAAAAQAAEAFKLALGDLFEAIKPDVAPGASSAGKAARMLTSAWTWSSEATWAAAQAALWAFAFCGFSLCAWRLGRSLLRTQVRQSYLGPSMGRAHVLMMLSNLRPDELERVRPLIGQGFDALCDAPDAPRIAWQQNLRALRPHLDRSRPTHLHLLTSQQSQSQAALFISVAMAAAARAGTPLTVSVAQGSPVDFDDFIELEWKIADAINAVMRQHDVGPDSICVDITSGTKMASIAGAVVTMNQSIVFSYVTTGGQALVFDARLVTLGG